LPPTHSAALLYENTLALKKIDINLHFQNGNLRDCEGFEMPGGVANAVGVAMPVGGGRDAWEPRKLQSMHQMWHGSDPLQCSSVCS